MTFLDFVNTNQTYCLWALIVVCITLIAVADGVGGEVSDELSNY